MSNSQLDRPPAVATADTWIRRAWVGVALVPVFFLVAFAVGEGMYALLGYKPENADAPVWAVAVVSALVVLVVLIPCVVAVHFGRRAVKAGDRRGMLPAVLAAVAGAGIVVLTIVSELGNVLRG